MAAANGRPPSLPPLIARDTGSASSTVSSSSSTNTHDAFDSRSARVFAASSSAQQQQLLYQQHDTRQRRRESADAVRAFNVDAARDPTSISPTTFVGLSAGATTTLRRPASGHHLSAQHAPMAGLGISPPAANDDDNTDLVRDLDSTPRRARRSMPMIAKTSPSDRGGNARARSILDETPPRRSRSPSQLSTSASDSSTSFSVADRSQQHRHRLERRQPVKSPREEASQELPVDSTNRLSALTTAPTPRKSLRRTASKRSSFDPSTLPPPPVNAFELGSSPSNASEDLSEDMPPQRRTSRRNQKIIDTINSLDRTTATQDEAGDRSDETVRRKDGFDGDFGTATLTPGKRASHHQLRRPQSSLDLDRLASVSTASSRRHEWLESERVRAASVLDDRSSTTTKTPPSASRHRRAPLPSSFLEGNGITTSRSESVARRRLTMSFDEHTAPAWQGSSVDQGSRSLSRASTVSRTAAFRTPRALSRATDAPPYSDPVVRPSSRRSAAEQPQQHHRLLQSAVDHVQLQREEDDALVERIAALASATTRLNATLAELAESAREAHLAEIVGEQAQPPKLTASQLSQVTQSLRRASDDQVRCLTETLIELTRSERRPDTAITRPLSRATTTASRASMIHSPRRAATSSPRLLDAGDEHEMLTRRLGNLSVGSSAPSSAQQRVRRAPTLDSPTPIVFGARSPLTGGVDGAGSRVSATGSPALTRPRTPRMSYEAEDTLSERRAAKSSTSTVRASASVSSGLGSAGGNGAIAFPRSARADTRVDAATAEGHSFTRSGGLDSANRLRAG